MNPCALPIGQVSAPPGFQGLLAGEHGIVKLAAARAAPLPAGRWKLLSYNLQPPAQTSSSRSSKKTATAALRTVDRNYVSAVGTKEGSVLEVREGQTAAIPFGPPYTPVVKATRRTGDNAMLEMALVGAGGEVCTNLLIAGRAPNDPEFTIQTPEGKAVDEGKFKFG